MRGRLSGVLVVTVLVLAAAAIYAIAAESGAPAGGAAPAAGPAAGPGGAAPAMTPEEMLARSEDRMKTSGASEGTIMRNRQMQMAQFAIEEPIGLVALKDQLKLTPEQLKKIQDIVASARTQAKAVLTKEQVDMIDKMKDTPDSVIAFSAQMRSRMGSRRGQRGGAAGGE